MRLSHPKRIDRTYLQESQPEVRAQWDFSASFAVDAPPQRCTGRVTEELEESHEQPELTFEDLNDKVLLRTKNTTNERERGPNQRSGILKMLSRLLRLRYGHTDQ